MVEESKFKKIGLIIFIFILIVLLIASSYYLIKDEEYSPLSVKTAFPYAEEVALNWSDDATLNKCSSVDNIENGNCSIWQFEFYSPSSQVHSNYTEYLHGDPYIWHIVNCDYLTVKVFMNKTTESKYENKSFQSGEIYKGHPYPFPSLNIDSFQAYQIASNNSLIISSLDDRIFETEIEYETFNETPTISVVFREVILEGEIEPDIFICEISPINGEVINIFELAIPL